METKITEEKISFLKQVALNLRIDSIRATTASKSGHPTSCMSAADIIAVVFAHFLKYDTAQPKYPNNDRFILSKGHAIPVVYAAWKQLGVISDEQLMTLRKFDSVLEGHPTPRFAYNEAATGSLGQGLAVGVGMAINAKHENLDYKTYVMMGDGEIAEGSVWEAAEIASHYKLDNLIGIVDCNRLGQSGESINNHHVEKYAKKFEAFGFKTFVINGHDIPQIVQAISNALATKGQPTAIIAKTFKGHGLSGVENKNGFHGKPFKQEELEQVISELKNNFSSFETDASHPPPDRRQGLWRGMQGEHTEYKPPLPSPVHGEEAQRAVSNHIDLEKDANTNLFGNGEKIATRKAFGYALAALGRVNKNIFVLDGDVKNSTFTEIFEKEFPDRFVQCFIAEQTIIGVTTGLELRGKIPFAATFGAFMTRAHDQIRMAGIGRNSLRLCGSHCGVSIGEDGPSQMALEDLAIFRCIPNSVVLYPSDGVSAYKLTELIANYNDGISYLRTSRPATSMIYDKNEKFEIGGCKVLHESNNDHACIIAAGITLREALKAYEKLKEQGVNVAVIDLYSVKPLDIQTIKKVAAKSKNRIITVEDHYLEGGLGEAVASQLTGDDIKVEILAVKGVSRSGKSEELLAHAGIDADSIVKKIIQGIQNV